MRKLIATQTEGVLGRMGRGKSLEMKAEASAAALASWLWEEKSETLKWQSTLTPYLREALETGALETAADIGIAFDVTDPAVGDFIAGRKLEIKSIVGNRTEELRASLQQGLQSEESMAQLMDRVKSYGADADWKAERVARTEVHNALNEGHLISGEQSGANTKTWVATLDARTREGHEALDGATVAIDEDFYDPVAESGGPRPHDMNAAASNINCRCTIEFGFEGDAEPGEEPSGEEPVDEPGGPELRVAFDDWSDTELDAIVSGLREGGDGELEVIAQYQNFAQLPRVVEPDTLEGKVLYRGVSEARYAEQFRTGEYYGGRGMAGSGTYAAYGKQGAAEAAEYAKVSGKTGPVMRMQLPTDARVITSQEADLRAHADMIQLGTMGDARSKTLSRLSRDTGRWAAMHGYDAIDIGNMNYMVILNRSILKVEAAS